MRRSFNKFGSIEIDESILKYRIAVQELGLEDSLELEKEIKRKLQTLPESNSNNYLVPFSIEVVNRYMIMYYDLSHFTSLDYLRQIDLEDKIPYLLSLIAIAKEQEKGFEISWDRVNFVCDKHEEKVKVFLFETDSIKIYDTPTDLLKTVKDLICSTMTVLKTFTNLPRRQDFLDPSEENIRFIENVYRMNNLDDLYMYMETLSLDLEQISSNIIDREEEPERKRPTLFGKSVKKDEEKKPRKKAPTKNKKRKTTNYNAPTKKKRQTADDKKMKLGFGFVGFALVLYLLSTMLMPSAEEPEVKEIVPVASTDENGFFKGTANENIHLVEAYRKAYNSDYEESFNSLNQVEKNELDLKDVPLLIQVYDETGNLAVLLDEVPLIANDVVTYLLTRNKLDKLTDISASMVNKNPYIEFEKAHYNQEFEYMLTLVDKVDINGRKETQIIDGYLALEMPDEARKFAEKVGNPDLIKRVEEFKK